MYTTTKRARIKSTLSGLAAAMSAIMLSYAFGGQPSVAIASQPSIVGEDLVVVLDGNDVAQAEQGQAQRRHMKRVLATPYLSVGRLLPRRGS